ncbi:hypothetical protein ATANTOWER_009577 [Ataeniobius toweri]|uniref:Uncharacterized protein n=1 Tax=Ataeniobius toweri TaxID=208326 RepID=A0ABU7C5R8_9TELE|nr:hypothetical protein [Ataeniobius toweri]
MWRELTVIVWRGGLPLEGVRSRGHHHAVRGIYLSACFKQQLPVICVRGHTTTTFKLAIADNKTDATTTPLTPVNISSPKTIQGLNIAFAFYIIIANDLSFCLNEKS